MKTNLPYLPIVEAADLLGLTTGRVRQMLRAKSLKGLKVGQRAWLIDKQDIKRLAAERRK